MAAIQLSGFGGIAGRVLKEATAGSSFLTGLVMLIALFLADWFFGQTGADAISTPVLHLMWAAALVRFGLNGFQGEWSGSVFSTAGGSWTEVGAVTARYMALTAVWVIPMALLDVDPLRSGEALGAVLFGMEGGTTISLLTLYIAATILTPPLFLVVSVSAIGFGDVFSPAHWRNCFSGRGGELFTVYSIYMGGVTAVCVLLFPVFVAVVVQSRGLGLLLGGCALIYASGFALSLLGRLCGFFAAFEGEAPVPGTAAVSAPLGGGDAAGRVSPLISRDPAPGSGAESASPGFADRVAHDAAHHASPARRLSVVEAPGGHKAPLMDARNRVKEIVERFEHNPAGAVAALRELCEEYTPHPLVLHALCLLLHRTGHHEASREVAKEAMPLFMLRGNLRLAAEVAHLHIDRIADLDLHHDEIERIALQLRENHLFDSSSRAYEAVLEEDPYETRSIKGMLQLAETHAHRDGALEAKRIYEFLLEHCSASPLAEYMRQGLEDAERRAAG
jgi:hypothetical protein